MLQSKPTQFLPFILDHNKRPLLPPLASPLLHFLPSGAIQPIQCNTDRWAESSLPSAKRARTSSEPLSNVAHATTNSTTTTPPKPANNADDNVEAPTAAAMAKPITEVVSAPSSTTVESGGAGTGGGGGEDDGGGIDVGMES